MTNGEEGRGQQVEIARRPISLVEAAGWTIALVLLMGVAVAITEGARRGASSDLVSIMACHTLAYSAVIFAMLRMYAPSSSMRVALGVRGASPLHVILSALAGAGLWPAMWALDEAMAQRFPPSAAEVEADERLFSATSQGGTVAIVLAMVVALPIAQELFFRGILFGGLKKGRTAALTAVATALLFAGSRFEARSIATALVLGLVLGLLRSQSGSVLSSIAAHASFFAVPAVPLLLHREGEAKVAYPIEWVIGGVGVVIGALVLGSLLTHKNARAIEARLDDD